MEATATARWAYVALGGGLALIAVYAAFIHDLTGTVLYLVVAAYATTLSVIGAARMPPARRRIWWAFAAAQVLFLVGDSLWTLFAEVLEIEPFPSVADVAYLAQYPLLALGMLWLVRGRRRGRDRAAFLDAAILTTGFTVVGMVFFVAPAASTGGSTTLSQVVAAAYPAGDLLVLALVVRLFTAGVASNVSLWALFGSMATLLVSDLVYVVTVVHEMAYPIWIDPAYLLSYLLLAFAVLHPSAHGLSEPAPDRPDRVTPLRLTWLAAALMLAPMTGPLAWAAGGEQGPWVVVIGGCLAAVLVVLRLSDVVSDLERTAVQLAALARKDGLTGVPNRRAWDHELSRSCAVARDEGTALSVAVLDMDHFKAFNDTFGHLMGDLVLKETAASWSSILEGRGLLARFGGEEFTALIPGATQEEALVLLAAMRRSVTHGQTCSIGLATWDGEESPGALVARADRALYYAKHHGRNRIAVDDGRAPTLPPQPTADPAVASMRTVYQPIYELSTGQLVGHEALSRFDGHDPQEVFASADRDGTAPWLEAAAIRSALAGWNGEGLLCVNTSPSVLLTAPLQDVLPEDLAGIVLELTESDLIDYTAEVMLAIDRLRARGALIAVDDFGIGFSNIQRVATLRPDIIKLDMSLVRGIDADTTLQGTVAAALLFAERTGSQVIAEGIETPEERDCLARLGVSHGQGFLLGTPESAPSASSRL